MPSTACPQPHPQAIHSYTHLVCHYGELTLRGKNRARFEDQANANLLARLRTIGICRVRKLPGRVDFVFAQPQPWNHLAEAFQKVFGFSNATGVMTTAPTIEAILAAVASALPDRQFATFAVRCRRVEKQLPLSSNEVCVRLGQAVRDLTGARVDLDHPEFIIWIQLLERQALIGLDRVEGARGLPIGLTGHVLALLSGGIDSPVATWRMMRRGCTVDALHFHSSPFTNIASQEKVRALAGRLAAWHGPIQLGMVPFGAAQQEIVARAPQDVRILLYRRLMLRIATAIAQQRRATALITGDALGQVASQTLSNLATVEAATSLPVLRPLLTMDKEEITALARRIGTYETSIEAHQDCCQFLEPDRPATSSRAADLAALEAHLPIDTLVTTALAATEWRTIGA